MMARESERQRRTPTVTRSYRSRDKIRLEKMFDVHRMLKMLSPSVFETEAIVRSAATIGAIQRKSGEYGDPRIPAPIDHIDNVFWYSDPEEPVWVNVEERDRSVLMLRCVNKMSKWLGEHLQDHTHTLVALTCPKCGEGTIDAIKGSGLVFDGNRLLTTDERGSVLDMTIACDCDGFTIDDILDLEFQALT